MSKPALLRFVSVLIFALTILTTVVYVQADTIRKQKTLIRMLIQDLLAPKAESNHA